MAIGPINRRDYLGNATADTYPYNFLVFSSAHLLVIQTDIATGLAAILTLNTDYTVDGVRNPAGGNVTLTAGVLATGQRLTILRRVDYIQPTVLRNQTQFKADSHEDGLDYLEMEIQQLKEITDRSLKLPESEEGSDALTVLPSAVDRADSVLGFDSDGTPVCLVQVPVGGLVTLATFFTGWLASSLPAFMQDFLNASSIDEALTKLGVSAYWRTRLLSDPATIVQNILDAADAPAILTLLGFGASNKFIVNDDITDATIGPEKLNFSISGLVAAVSGYDREVTLGKLTSSSVFCTYRQLMVAANSFSGAPTATISADYTVSGAGGLDSGFETSLDHTDTWFTIWAICKSDGSALALMLSTSMTSPIMPSGYATGFKTRIGFVYKNTGGDFDPFKIRDGWFDNLISVNQALYRSMNGTFSYDSSSQIANYGNVWYTLGLNSKTSPPVETEVEFFSEQYVGISWPASTYVYAQRTGVATGSSDKYRGLPVSLGDSIHYASAGNHLTQAASASARVVQTASRNIDFFISLYNWSYPSWYLWVRGFRVTKI